MSDPTSTSIVYRNKYWIVSFLFLIKLICFFLPMEQSHNVFTGVETFYSGGQTKIWYLDFIFCTVLVLPALFRKKKSDLATIKSSVVTLSLIFLFFWLVINGIEHISANSTIKGEDNVAFYVLVYSSILSFSLAYYLAFRKEIVQLPILRLSKPMKISLIVLFTCFLCCFLLPSIRIGLPIGNTFIPGNINGYELRAYYFYLILIIIIMLIAVFHQFLYNERFLLIFFSILLIITINLDSSFNYGIRLFVSYFMFITLFMLLAFSFFIVFKPKSNN